MILLLVYFGNNCDSNDTRFERFDRGAENSSNRWEQICGLEGELQKKSGNGVWGGGVVDRNETRTMRTK